MAIRRAAWETVPMPPPSPLDLPSPTFGALVRFMRGSVGLSQNQLARMAGINAAYVCRMEADNPNTNPSRTVVLRLYEALRDGSTLLNNDERLRAVIGHDDRERLLVAAGYAPQAIVDAGGWDAYKRRLRRVVIDRAGSLIDDFNDALEATREQEHL